MLLNKPWQKSDSSARNWNDDSEHGIMTILFSFHDIVGFIQFLS
jgi:hypothetical protein